MVISKEGLRFLKIKAHRALKRSDTVNNIKLKRGVGAL